MDHAAAHHREAALQRQRPCRLAGRRTPPSHRAGARPRPAGGAEPAHPRLGGGAVRPAALCRPGAGSARRGPGRGPARASAQPGVHLHPDPWPLWRDLAPRHRRVLAGPPPGLLRALRLGLRRRHALDGRAGAHRHRLPGLGRRGPGRLPDRAQCQCPRLGRVLGRGPRLGAQRSDRGRRAQPRHPGRGTAARAGRARPVQPDLVARVAQWLGDRQQPLAAAGAELLAPEPVRPAQAHGLQPARLDQPRPGPGRRHPRTGPGRLGLDTLEQPPTRRLEPPARPHPGALARAGVDITAHESPAAWARALRKRHGQKAEPAAQWLEKLERARYAPNSAAPPWGEFRAAARMLRA
jgi:hypothetical protein